jgi:hypothetical protein
MMLDQSRIVTFSGRLYTLLLLAYPTRFRRAYGREMAQVFRDDIRGTFQESGRVGLIGLWFLVVLDLLKTAFAEHIWEVFHMQIEKLERWSGLAGALGGVLFVYVYLSLNDTNEGFVGFLIPLLPTMLLWAIALGGLYRRLPTTSHPGNKITLVIALISLLLLTSGLLLLILTESDSSWYLIVIGFNGLMVGIAGMGIVALMPRAMGVWRFVPLLLAGAFLGFILSSDALQPAFAILVAVGWLLLGVAIWTSAKDVPDPALPA